MEEGIISEFSIPTMGEEGFGPRPKLIDLADFESWILEEDDDILAIDKPGWVVCHPSKRGPLSSLVGASRLYTGIDNLHLVSRLDRETSGVVLLAKCRRVARRFQMALQERTVEKVYFAILEGDLREPVRINRAIGRDPDSAVAIRQTVRRSRKTRRAVSCFEPLINRNSYSLVRIRLETGRKHQIRVHVYWLGHTVVGDKIYGPDETLYLEFFEKGWTVRLGKALPLQRQAIHAANLRFNFPDESREFMAPLPPDIREFCCETMGIAEEELEEVTKNSGPLTAYI